MSPLYSNMPLVTNSVMRRAVGELHQYRHIPSLCCDGFNERSF